MKFMLLIIHVFAQLQMPTALPTMAFPTLESPTPYMTPTPQATLETYFDDAESLLMTATAAANTGFTANGDNQVSYNNRPLLPNVNSEGMQSTFSYLKWIASGNLEAVFGQLSILIINFGILFTITILWLGFSWLTYLGTLIFSVIVWIADWIVRIIRG